MGGYARVVHKHIDFLELLGQFTHELPNFLHTADIELDNMDLDALGHLLNLFLDLLQRILATRRQDKLQVGLRARKLQRGALSNPRAGTRDQDCLAGEALGLTGAHSCEVCGQVAMIQMLQSREERRAGLMCGDEATEDLGWSDKISWAKRNHVQFEDARRGN